MILNFNGSSPDMESGVSMIYRYWLTFNTRRVLLQEKNYKILIDN